MENTMILDMSLIDKAMTYNRAKELAKIKELNETKLVSKVVEYLERQADLINKFYFNNRLKDYAITLQRTKGAYGHFVTKKTIEIEKKNYFEININPGCFMGSDNKQVITTLIHEMVHLDCNMKGIKDVGSNGWHRKEFRYAAESVGLVVERCKRIGNRTPSYKQTLDFSLFEYIDFKDEIGILQILGLKADPKKRNKKKQVFIDKQGDVYELSDEENTYIRRYLHRTRRAKGNRERPEVRVSRKEILEALKGFGLAGESK